MKEKTKITLILGGIVLLVIGVISVSFAFLSITRKQDIANNFTSGCLNISIENESAAITLSNTYPITDVEGLGTTGYTFTIKNTCSTSTNYQINLESLNQTSNTLDTKYIKTSLSSDTMDNLIQKLDSNMVTKAYIENAYVSHNLYQGTIAGNSTKEFILKEWIDYDTTKEQGANKTYTSKINVIANPDLEVTPTPEIKTTLVNNTLEGTITGDATTAEYCISDSNACEPNTNATIADNKINMQIKRYNNQIICFKANNKTTCSNTIEKLPPLTIESIITRLNIKETEPDFNQIATEDEGIYKAKDGMYGGYSYYWRGAVTNNYVKFANFCWRIVRINGDRTMRLIYDGATCHVNGANTGSVVISNQAYNKSEDHSEYVGYTYEKGSQRGTTALSNLKIQNENWYNSNLASYGERIADGKFCNDRNTASGYIWLSQSIYNFHYAARERLDTGKAPTLECSTGDVYTLKVGAITADEVAFAGGIYSLPNFNYYLCTYKNYWTISPYTWYNDNHALVFYVSSNGALGNDYVTSEKGIRPVINLKANTEFKYDGDGTIDNPYIVAN